MAAGYAGLSLAPSQRNLGTPCGKHYVPDLTQDIPRLTQGVRESRLNEDGAGHR